MNNISIRGELKTFIPQKIFIMLMRIFILIIAISSAQAFPSYSQTRIDIEVENVSIEQLFLEIQNVSDFHFFYKDKIIDNGLKVSMDLKDVELEVVLSKAFEGTSLDYKVDGKQVIIKKRLLKAPKDSQEAKAEANPAPIPPDPITGVVTDKKGEALPGVNIVISGTSRGAQTNGDGSYEVEAEVGDQLIFSFIGMETKTIRVGDSKVINVALKETTSVLGDVVVVAYGQETKESLTGSVAVIGKRDLEQIPVSTFEQSLRGNVAGLQASAIDGAPGANTQVRIRGIGSISASSEPLYVIDGVPIQSGDISSLNGNGGRSQNVMAAINPNDIESISVLKDASATAIYGSRGANGVILVTTKSGSSGQARISVNSLIGFNSAAYNDLLQPLNAQQYTQLFLEGWINNGDTPAEAQQRFENTFLQAIDPVTGDTTDTDWLEAISRVGITHSHTLSATGGSEKFKYYFSGGYFDQESYIIGSDFRRFSARANMEYAVNDNITVSNNIFISQSEQHTFEDGGSWTNPMKSSLELSPLIPIYDSQGRFNGDHVNYFPMGGSNPVGLLSGDDIREIKQMRIMDNFAVSIKFLEDFTFRSQWNFDIITLNEYQYANPRYAYAMDIDGYAANANTVNTSWTGTQTLNYLKELAPRHNLNLLAGYEAQKSNREIFSASGTGFPNDKLKTLNSTSTSFAVSGERTAFAFTGVFARASYDFAEKYYFSSSIRRDGSSRFGSENRYGLFYSFGLGWVLNREGFLSSVNFVDFLRIRSSWGLTGNAAIGNFSYAGLYTYGQDYNGSPGGRPAQIGNPNLGWERQTNFNIGLDFDLFSRLGGTVEYFKRTSSDLILDVPLSLTTGFQSLTQNFGEMENTGVEITLNADLISNRNGLSWTFGLNFTKLNNQITRLTEDFIDGTYYRQEGQDFQSFYLLGWAGVDQSNGDPLWYTDETKSETTNSPGQASRFFDGKTATPDFFGGFNTTLSYKGLSLNAQFMYSYGNYVFDGRARGSLSDGRLTPRSTALVAFENRWVPGKTDATWPQHKWGGQPGSNERANSRWLYDGSFLRLKNVTLAYELPVPLLQSMNIESLRVFLRGTNLLTFTKEDLYLDPEQSINGEFDGMTPALRTISIGVDLGI